MGVLPAVDRSEKATVSGYSRVWQTVAGEDVATIVPKRPGAKDIHEFGLWANYAMDRDDNAILEDWYRYANSADAGYGAEQDDANPDAAPPDSADKETR